MTINRRALQRRAVLIVDEASIELAAADAGWNQGDQLVFAGTLEEILIFALKHFAVNPLTIAEEYSIVSERVYQKSTKQPVVPIDLSQGATVYVDPEELLLVQDVTANYREDFSNSSYAVFELLADSTRSLWRGSRMAMLAYMLQIADGSVGEENRIWKLNNFSIFSPVEVQAGAVYNDILSSTVGAVELDKARVTLGMAIATLTLAY